MAQVNHDINGATPDDNVSTTEVTITNNNEELSENLYRLVVLSEQHKEIAEESTTTTKEQLGFVRDSLDDIRDALTESSDVKKNQIGLAENQLGEMNKNINTMLGILEGQYNLQKESQDLVKRAASEGKSTVKPTVVKKTTPITPSTTSKLTGGLGDLLSTLTGLLGFGAKAAGPMKLLREISRLPIKILTKSAGLILKSSMSVAKAGLKGLDLITGKIVSKFASRVGSLMGGLVGKAGKLLAGSLKIGVEKILPKILLSLNVVGDIASMLSWVWEYIREGLFNAVKGNKFLEGLVSTVDRIIMPISNFFDDLGGAVLGLFTGNTAKVTAKMKNMLQDVADLSSGLINPILNIFNYAKTFLGGLATAAFAAMKNPWHAVDAFSASMAKTMNEAESNLSKTTPTGLMQSSAQRDLGQASQTGDMSGTTAQNSGGFFGTITKGYNAAKEEALALKAGISSGLSGLSLANFLGQLKTETGFKSSEESGKYTYDRARTVFPKYAQQITNLQNQSNKKGSDFVDPRQLFNITYGGRMGNTAADDGYKYRGRGLIQLTGKNNYIKYGNMLGIDLVNNPDLAADPEIAAKIAALYYKTSGAADKAAKGDLVGARKSVQGGSLGLSESANYTREYMAKLNAGQMSPTTSAPQYRALPTSSGSVRMINNTTGEALSGAETAQLTAGMAQNMPQYQKYFNKPSPAITPMVKPMMSVSTENIKPIPQDKTVQKQQSQILANISAQQTTTMDLSMDTLPHSELLMMRNMGKLT